MKKKIFSTAIHSISSLGLELTLHQLELLTFCLAKLKLISANWGWSWKLGSVRIYWHEVGGGR